MHWFVRKSDRAAKKKPFALLGLMRWLFIRKNCIGKVSKPGWETIGWMRVLTRLQAQRSSVISLYWEPEAGWFFSVVRNFLANAGVFFRPRSEERRVGKEG